MPVQPEWQGSHGSVTSWGMQGPGTEPGRSPVNVAGLMLGRSAGTLASDGMNMELVADATGYLVHTDGLLYKQAYYYGSILFIFFRIFFF